MSYRSNEFSTLASQGSYVTYTVSDEEIPLLKELPMQEGTMNAYDNTTHLRNVSGVIRIIKGFYIIDSDVALSGAIRIPVSSGGTENDDMFQYLLANAIRLRLGYGYSLETFMYVIASWVIAYIRIGKITYGDTIDNHFKGTFTEEELVALQEELLDPTSIYYEPTIAKIAYSAMHMYFSFSSLLGLWSLNTGIDLYSLVMTPSANS